MKAGVGVSAVLAVLMSACNVQPLTCKDACSPGRDAQDSLPFVAGDDGRVDRGAAVVVAAMDGDVDRIGVVDAGFAPDVAVSDGSGNDAAVGVVDAGFAPDIAVSDSSASDATSWTRDWTLNPPVFMQTGALRLWGLSDVHGDRDRLVVLLSAAGLIDGSVSPPVWTGGSDTLVVSGDNIDKGPQSIEVLEIWMALIPQAEMAGGHLVVLLGNHEAEFLADPLNSKAAPLVAELPGSESPASFASSDDPHGRFLRERPIAALVDGWFFSHAGNSGGLSADQIGATFQALVDLDAWSNPFFLDPNSILEARSWWPSGASTNQFLDGYLAVLPGNHLVFGHHPTTFADPPSGNIEAHNAGRLLLIDVGMSVAVNYSTGKLLRVDAPGTPQEQASMVTPTGGMVALDLTAP